MKRFVVAAILSLATAQPAYAIGCQGTVSTVSLTPEGDVYADIGLPSGGFKVCVQGASLTVNRGASGTTTINASQCQALYSGFWSAMAAGKPVKIVVDQANCTLTNGGGLPNPYPSIIYFLNQ